MAKFLYGAAVQGIQNFIFQTDKLREIVGASEIVESICTLFFKDKVGVKFDDKCLLIGAAGNIKYLFDNEADCKQMVLNFPKQVMEFAPGITISQAVVKIDGSLTTEYIDLLEDRLRIQRNKAVAPVNFGTISTVRCRRTGLAAVDYLIKEKKYENKEAVDAGTATKIKFTKEDQKYKPAGKITLQELERLPYDFEEMIKDSDKSWMAVIHADGNGLGKVLQQLGTSVEKLADNELINAYKEFSIQLDKSTIAAAQKAKDETFNSYALKEKRGLIPFRPIVLGGDDLTVIVRSQEALKFTTLFLQYFEVETKTNMAQLFAKYKLSFTKLTACAGIAYIKSSFPFHYGYNLAEQLCGEAKKISKPEPDGISPSCLMFHKVQSSYIAKYGEIVEQELTCYDGFSFKYGPYYLDKAEGSSIGDLAKLSELIQQEGAPAAQIRKWLTERYANKEKASMLMERTIQVLDMDSQRKKYVDDLSLKDELASDRRNSSQLYDIVSMASLLKN